MVLQYFRRLFSHSDTQKQAYKLYGRAVTWARRPVFYSHAAVEDSLDGRFDMILVHIYLLVNRLGQEVETEELQRSIQEVLITDMDRTLREMGVGDMGVGKQVKNMGAAWLGRSKAYDAALASVDDSLLSETIARNIYRFEVGETASLAEAPPYATIFAGYMRACQKGLAAVDIEALSDLGDDWALEYWPENTN